MTDKYFDVQLTMTQNDFEKNTLSRVVADDALEAVLTAMGDEFYYMEPEEVEQTIRDQYHQSKSLIGIKVVDTDHFEYKVEDVVELQKVEVEVNNEKGFVLLPVEGLQTRSKMTQGIDYFVS